MKTAWNIKQLNDARIEDLKQCNNDFERSMVNAIAGREIRELAQGLTRKLTPCEVAIASQFGYRV